MPLNYSKKLKTFSLLHPNNVTTFIDYFKYTFKNELKDCTSLLEIGCGTNSRATPFTHNLYSIGLDLHSPSLIKNKEKKYFSDYLVADITQLPFKKNSFDVVVASDVIEHLSKPQGMTLLSDMEQISRKKTIIFTPNGFNSKHNLEDNNPLQIHKSGWITKEFSNQGYKVFGINGLLALRGEKSKPTIKPEFLGHFISKLTNRIVFHSPERAFHLLCIKNKKIQNPTSQYTQIFT